MKIMPKNEGKSQIHKEKLEVEENSFSIELSKKDEQKMKQSLNSKTLRPIEESLFSNMKSRRYQKNFKNFNKMKPSFPKLSKFGKGSVHVLENVNHGGKGLE